MFSIGVMLGKPSSNKEGNICIRRDCLQNLSDSFPDVFGIGFQINGKPPFRNAYSADSRQL